MREDDPVPDRSKVYKHGKHRSDAEQRIAKVPVIEVDGELAVCTGGGGALGHPIEYMTMVRESDKPETCKYCGLRYQMKKHTAHH